MKTKIAALLLTVLFSSSSWAVCDGGNVITDAVEGAVVGGVIGAVVGDAGAGSALGVVDGAFAEAECDDAITDAVIDEVEYQDDLDYIEADILLSE